MHVGDNRDNGGVSAGSVAVSGGSWASASNAGVFHWNVNSSSDGNSNYGSRLVVKCLIVQRFLYVVNSIDGYRPASWQNIKVSSNPC